MTVNRSCARSLLAFVTLLLMATLVIPLQAQEWTYRVRPGDNIWDLSAKYLKQGRDWRQLQSHNRIADPHKLPPGSKLQFPISWLRAEPLQATVVEVSGNATVSLPGQAAAPAQASQKLPMGTRIDTGNDSNMTLQFADGTRLLLRAGSQLSLDRLSSFGGGAMVDTRLRLQRGRITNSVRKQADGGAASFHVTTPNASSAVRGTVFRVDANDDGTQAEVLEGSVSVSAGRQQALVADGYGTSVAKGQTGAIRTIPLLPAPDVSAIPLVQRKVRPELAWDEVPGAREYRVQVAPTAEFSTLLVDKAYTQAKAILPVLEDGDYAVRINAVDTHGLAGRDAQLAISVQARPEPPFVIAPTAGSTVKSPQPQFRWSGVENAANYRIEVASDADFTQIVSSTDAHTGTEFNPSQALQPGAYYWRIATRNRAGKLGPNSDVMAFTLKPLPEVGEVGSEGDAKSITLRWSEGDPSMRYRFQIARDREFRDLRVDEMLEEPQITIPKLGSGTWYLRAQTIDAHGYEGPFPSPQTLQLPCRSCQWATGAGLLLLLIGL